MFRYLALMWNNLDPGPSNASNTLVETLRTTDRTFRLSFEAEGMRILCADESKSGMKAHVLARNHGVVLGTIFKRHVDVNDESRDAPATFDSAETEQLIASRGRRFMSGYWGDYVALLSDRSSSTRYIIKDPVGNLPCYMTSWREVLIAFSCLNDLIDLKLLSFSVNWSYVAARVGSAGYDLRMSSLNEIEQVTRGECLTIPPPGALRTKTLYWKPTDFSDRHQSIADATAACRALRATVKSATTTWAAGHNSILMRLSGGLDSSVIAGCLKGRAADTNLTSYAYFVPKGRSDERRWARLASDFAGSTHIEVPFDPSTTRLQSHAGIRPTVAPAWAYAYAIRNEMERQIHESHPYTAVFCGDGGDSTLGGECIAFAVDDFIRFHGLSRGALKLAAQVALRTHSLAWTVLAKALHRRLVGYSMADSRDSLLIGATMANPAIRGQGLKSGAYPHPWFDRCLPVPWHVISRLGNLLGEPTFYDPFLAKEAVSPYVTAPLYSQPVVELSLRIPVHILFHNGQERGLARAAFAQCAPQSILRRQWKDRAPGVFEELVRHNRAFLYETLMGGVLRKEGFLDRAALEAALNGGLSTRQFHVIELMHHFHLENWLRNFTDNVSRRPAS